MRRICSALAAFAVGAGCSAAQSSDDYFADDSIASGTWRDVYDRMERASPRPGTPIAVGVARNQLIGMELESKTTWTRPLEPVMRPHIAGEMVVVQTSSGDVVALRAADGTELWRTRVRGSLLGAGDDGETTALTFAGRGGRDNSLLIVDRGGRLLTELRSNKPMGEPAMIAGLAILPWDGHQLSAITKEGAELGRIRTAITVSRSVMMGSALVTGHWNQVLLVNEVFVSGRPVALALPGRQLPGHPVWLANGYEADRELGAQLFARPAASTERTLAAQGRYATTYKRLLFGLDASSDELIWVSDARHSILGGAAAEEGFAVCTEQGKILLVHHEGGIAAELDLGSPLSMCTVQTGDLSIPSTKNSILLRDQLAAAMQVFDTGLIPAQTWLLGELARDDDPEVTRALIDVASNARTSPDLRNTASEYLSRRRTGAEYMLEALDRHYDFLSDVLLPPPVGALADALAELGDKRAAPALSQHLNDPSNSPEDVERAARALSKLASPSEAAELKTFFSLYRATADQPALVRAVVHAAKALLKVGGAEGKELVERAARDPLTQPDIKQALNEIMTPDTVSARAQKD